MTCQFCQTWNTDEEHRCRRCGRRLNSASARISPGTYPIAATARAQVFDTATAPALNRAQPSETLPESEPGRRAPEHVQSGQPLLFDAPTDSRVVSVDSMRSPIEREAIRARAAEAIRPAPPRVQRAEVSRQERRTTAPRSSKPRGGNESQQRFEFTHQQAARTTPHPNIVCEAPIAPVGMRLHAIAIDGLIIALGWIAALAPFLYFGGLPALDKTTALWFAALFAAVSISYRLIWILSGQDSIGMQVARIRLVDFYGNRPRQTARYHRLIGTLISVLPAGLGLLWTFVDEDGLMWQDHISNTFPSLAE